MHVTVTAGAGAKLKKLYIHDPHPWCSHHDIFEVQDDTSAC